MDNNKKTDCCEQSLYANPELIKNSDSSRSREEEHQEEELLASGNGRVSTAFIVLTHWCTVLPKLFIGQRKLFRSRRKHKESS